VQGARTEDLDAARQVGGTPELYPTNVWRKENLSVLRMEQKGAVTVVKRYEDGHLLTTMEIHGKAEDVYRNNFSQGGFMLQSINGKAINTRELNRINGVSSLNTPMLNDTLQTPITPKPATEPYQPTVTRQAGYDMAMIGISGVSDVS
jgi:hypothetical protein